MEVCFAIRLVPCMSINQCGPGKTQDPLDGSEKSSARRAPYAVAFHSPSVAQGVIERVSEQPPGPS